ncbi:MAG: pilus assembly protein PilZ [Robiginitomaculum sp.]|nr:MAG: pilus assembly protein PilZ [Robiginitomaculum sp.]
MTAKLKKMTVQPEKLDKRRARVVARLAAENRHFTRGKLAMGGRFLAENGWEYPCEIKDISPGGLSLQSDFQPPLGQDVILMTEELGRIHGKILRLTDGGFVAIIKSTTRKRDQLADQLTWLMNAERLGLDDDRAEIRTQHHGNVHLEMKDGTRFVASAIDISISGLAVESTEHVTLGEPVKVGTLCGTISRRLASGFAIQFTPPMPNAENA